jgi:hypothetical protein
MLALLLALAAAPAEPAPPPAAAATSAPEAVLDTVLPCGLRVLTARDMSLPVAAVILAVETGFEDDPPELPGLVHALAYQVEQGNRELRPGEALATAQDAGGIYGLATGPAQVRFESVVPMSRLDAALWTESQRLRFPTTNPARWQQALGWAASDERTGSRLRPEALAYVHGTPGLAHDGRGTAKALANLVEGALAAQLAGKFNYARSVLVVVAPAPPQALLEQVAPLFAGLPPAPHAAPLRVPGPRGARSPDAAAVGGKLLPGGVSGAAEAGAGKPEAAPGKPEAGPTVPGKEAPPSATEPPPAAATVPLSRQRGHTFVWAVPPTAAGGAWAATICRAVNRQKKPPEPEEPRKARLSCDYEPDPRRGVLIFRPSGHDDPWALVRGRLSRLAPGGADAALLQGQAAAVAQAIRLAARTPRGLARILVGSGAPRPQGAASHEHRVDELTGVASLADPAGLLRDAPALLRVEDAVVLTFPEAAP